MIVFQIVAITAFAPLVHGLLKRLRANLQGRPGPSPVQPYRNLAKLLRKEAVLPGGMAPLALVAPGVSLGVALTFAAVVPLSTVAVASPIDVVALVFLLGTSRFLVALCALDSRSAFAGMGSSRDMTFACLAEPTLLLALLGAASLGDGTQLSALSTLPFGLAGLLAFAAFFIVLLAETARIPIDNQETHFELTMIHEGLVLEFSGWQLATLELAAYVRQGCFLLLAAVLLPGSSLWWHLLWLAAIACGVCVVETLFAKLRLFEVPQLLLTAFILAVTSIGLRFVPGLAL
jgi:formate hydrogenlyase subunit 4